MPGDLLDNRGRGEAGWSWPSVHPEGRKFALIAAGLGLICALFASAGLGWLLGGLTLAIAAFFRDPRRVTPLGNDLIVAPADGLITLIRKVAPPIELLREDDLGTPLSATEPMTRIAIFMSVFDVHINRAPIGGIVRRLVYIPGKFLNADLDKASEENERQYLLIERGDGLVIGLAQIAGLVARRIVPFVKTGDSLTAGERIGLIRFGSRVDVYLPAGTEPTVLIGQTVIAGETVLARIGQSALIEGLRQ